MENLFFSPPWHWKQTKGANLQRQQTGRGPCLHVHVGSALCESHSGRHLHRRVASGEEMKGLILFLRGQGDHMALKARGTRAGSWCFSLWLLTRVNNNFSSRTVSIYWVFSVWSGAITCWRRPAVVLHNTQKLRKNEENSQLPHAFWNKCIGNS